MAKTLFSVGFQVMWESSVMKKQMQLSLPVTRMKLPATGMYPRITKLIFDEWQEVWDCCAGNKLQTISYTNGTAVVVSVGSADKNQVIADCRFSWRSDCKKSPRSSSHTGRSKVAAGLTSGYMSDTVRRVTAVVDFGRDQIHVWSIEDTLL